MTRTAVKGPLAFTGSNGTNLETYDSSFTQIQSGQGAGYLTIQSNRLGQAFGDGSRFIYRDATPTYSGDQYAQTLLYGLTNDQANTGIVLRCNSDTNANADYYMLYVNSSVSPKETNLVRVNNGSLTTLDNRSSISYSDGDSLSAEIYTDGSNAEIQVYKNGTLQYTYTDTSPLSGGKPGIMFQGASAGVIFQDDWEAGDFVASTDYTITSDQGTYSVTGQTANLLFNRKMAAAQGSYTLTGQNATLTYDAAGAYTLTADHGTYTITGSDAYRDIAITMSHGTYSVSGQSATLTPATSGSYTITADFGSYSVTGQIAGLTPTFTNDYSMPADYGVYTYFGRIAHLLAPGDVPTFGPGDKYTKLVLMGYSGALNDMLLKYYRDNGATSYVLNEAEMQFLALQGATAVPLNNRRRQFYTSLGYTGSLNDMEYAYWWNL